MVPAELWTEVEVNCYMVERGKPASAVPVQDRHVRELVDSITQGHGLKAHTEKLSDGWCTLWIYRYPHMLEVIKAMKQVPASTFDHWVLGKLFGYSEEAIAEFLTDLGK